MKSEPTVISVIVASGKPGLGTWVAVYRLYPEGEQGRRSYDHPRGHSLFRLAKLIGALAERGQAKVRPFLGVGIVGWTADITLPQTPPEYEDWRHTTHEGYIRRQSGLDADQVSDRDLGPTVAGSPAWADEMSDAEAQAGWSAMSAPAIPEGPYGPWPADVDPFQDPATDSRFWVRERQLGDK